KATRRVSKARVGARDILILVVPRELHVLRLAEVREDLARRPVLPDLGLLSVVVEHDLVERRSQLHREVGGRDALDQLVLSEAVPIKGLRKNLGSLLLSRGAGLGKTRSNHFFILSGSRAENGRNQLGEDLTGTRALGTDGETNRAGTSSAGGRQGRSDTSVTGRVAGRGVQRLADGDSAA